jgi:hypothetical protein
MEVSSASPSPSKEEEEGEEEEEEEQEEEPGRHVRGGGEGRRGDMLRQYLYCVLCCLPQFPLRTSPVTIVTPMWKRA